MVAKILQHKKQSTVPTDVSSTFIRPQEDWNGDAHDFWLGGRASSASTDTLLDADLWSLVRYTFSGSVVVTLPTPTASAAFRQGWTCVLRTASGTTLTLTPTGATINGASSITVPADRGAFIYSDGTNY